MFMGSCKNLWPGINNLHIIQRRPEEAHSHLGLGLLYLKIDRGQQARPELSSAIDLYLAMDMTFWLPQAQAALAQVEGK